MAAHSLDASVATFQTQDDVHLHLFSLFLAKRECEEEAVALLNSTEVQALARIRAPQRRCEFLYGRALLRRLLACYVGAAATDILIELNSQGKPWARTLACRSMPVFNVSHSGDVLVIAMCASGAIGVDVEHASARLENDMEGIAQSHFARDEYSALMGRPPEQRLDMFFRMWTLKEAILKAIGVGLYQPMNQINVAVPAARYDVLLRNAGDDCRLTATHVQSREMNFHVAIARVGALGVVNIFDHMQEEVQVC